MANLDRLKERRAQVQNDAIARWQQRAEIRASNGQKVAAGGPGAADSPTRRAHLATRETVLRQASALRAIGQLPVFIERKIGPTLDFFASAPSEAARRAGLPVARIVDSVRPDIQPNGFATGFLIAPNLLITNWHVFPTVADAVGTGANFGHERDETGVRLGETFALDPTTFFVVNERLDYCVIAINERSLDGQTIADLGVVTLVEATPKILIGSPVNIIEYPEGGEKKWATANNRLLDILDEGFLHYETDTLEGASGSPVYSGNWELVALHHAGVPRLRDGKILAVNGQLWTEDMGDDQVDWEANEGIRVSAIVKSLAEQTLANPAQAKILAELLATSSDPVDDLTQRLLVPETAGLPAATPVPTAPGQAWALDQGSRGMATNQFTFSGPVTIHVYAAGAAYPLPAAPSAPALEAALEKSIRFDRNYTDREGFQENFLGSTPELCVPKPGVAPERLGEMLRTDGNMVLELPYHHYTLAMNAKRRLQMWSAVNVDYDPSKKSAGGRASFGTDKWIADPRIPERTQIFDSEIYVPAHQIDRGHIVRREDSAWGNSDLEIEFANSDTFHWTNCTPQHQAFNRDSPGSQFGGIHGLWGNFEAYVQSSLQQGDTRACILAGPVLAPDDPTADFGLGPVQYPLVFWKVVVVAVPQAAGAPGLKVFGFVLSQKDVVDKFGIEDFAPGRFTRYQQPLKAIETLTGVTFDASLHAVDASRVPTP